MRSLFVQMLLALALAVGVGLWLPSDASMLGISVLGVLQIIGTLFLNALKMVVVPLIMSALIVGISNLDQTVNAARLGYKTLAYYAVSTTLAITIGLLCVNGLQPGVIESEDVAQHIATVTQSDAGTDLDARFSEKRLSDLGQVFVALFPDNLVAAAAEGQLLGLVVFSVLFGLLLRRIDPKLQPVQRQFWQGINAVLMLLVEWIIRFAPLGVFALLAAVLLKLDATQAMALGWVLIKFGLTVLLALVLHMFVSLSMVMRLFKLSVRNHLKQMRVALLTAFSTASSAATLPLTLQAAKAEGISESTASFVLPLGATVNMDGTALYECVVVMFIAQVMGIDLSWVQQLTVVIVALLTSIGVAGVPAASLVAIAIILEVVGLPLAMMALILPMDRILDMCRTAVNVYSDSCGAAVIDQSEKTALHKQKKTPN